MKTMSADDCAICLQPVEDTLATLRCGHVFHSECILSSFAHGNDTCCLCRERLIDTPFQRLPLEEEEEPRSFYRIGERGALVRGLSLREYALPRLRDSVRAYEAARSQLQSMKREASRRRTVLRDLQKKCIREVNLLKKTVDRRASQEFRVGFRIYQRDFHLSQWEMAVARSTLISLAARYSSMPFSEAKRKLRRETEAIRVIETAMRRLGLLSGSIPRDGL